jgi:predicted alpha/beta hydrolase family esterase
VTAPGDADAVNAVIVHGKPSREEYYDPAQPSPSNAHWLPWLAKQLMLRDIHAHTPEMPRAYAPDFAAWSAEFARYDVGPRTLLVGHSCGGGFLTRWLSEHPDVRVGRVVLVAPWIDPDHRHGDLFDFTIDHALAERAGRLIIFNSDTDAEEVQRSGRLIRDAVPGAVYREFSGYGHFCLEDLGGPAFPDLLVALLATP